VRWILQNLKKLPQKTKEAFQQCDKMLLTLCIVATAFGCLIIASTTNASSAGALRYLLIQIGTAIGGIFVYLPGKFESKSDLVVLESIRSFDFGSTFSAFGVLTKYFSLSLHANVQHFICDTYHTCGRVQYDGVFKGGSPVLFRTKAILQEEINVAEKKQMAAVSGTERTGNCANIHWDRANYGQWCETKGTRGGTPFLFIGAG
jgi:hypothetical protein